MLVLRLKNQRHPPAFHLASRSILLNCHSSLLILVNNVAPQVQVGHLASLELQRELNLVPFLEELAGVIDLDHQIVVADLDGFEFQLFELPGPRSWRATCLPFFAAGSATCRNP